MEVLDLTKANGEALFENLRGWLRPEDLAKKTGFAVGTIYNWRHAAKSKNIPREMFVKVGGRLFVRTEVFKTWISSENPDLEW